MTEILELLLQKKEAKNDCERRIYSTIIDIYSRDSNMELIKTTLQKILKNFEKTTEIEFL